MQEAREITSYIKDIHHSRKISHQQVNYPDTVQKLSAIMSQKTLLPSRPESSHFTHSLNSTASDVHKSMNIETKSIKLKEHQQKLTGYMQSERYINERKRLYNREVGRKAVVNQVR